MLFLPHGKHEGKLPKEKRLMKASSIILWIAAFLGLLFAPGVFGNPVLNRLLICAMILMLCDFKSFKIGLPGKLFLGWIFWAFISSLFLGNKADLAFQGFNYRMEGLPTWIVLACLALAYHSTFKNHKWLIGALSLALIYLYCRIDLLIDREGLFANLVFPRMAMSGLACLMAMLLWTVHPAWILAVIPLLSETNRACIIALFAGITAFELLKHRNKFNLKIIGSIALGIFFLVGLVFMSPIGKKFRSLDHRTIGLGARSQWLLQASDLTKEMPITGYGLDSLSRKLKPSQGVIVEKRAIPDKVHNLAYDLILSTGWIGYTILLLAFGAAFSMVWKAPTEANNVYFAVLVSWIAFHLFNPSGIPAHAVMLVSLFGIKSHGKKAGGFKE